MQKTNNLQEIFLTQVRRDRRPVTMFLMNGWLTAVTENVRSP